VRPCSIIYILLFAGCFCGCTRSTDPAARASEFTRNIYTGKSMEADEWLTKDILKSKTFVTFGGFDALVNDSMSEAKRNNGLQKIKIIKVTKERDKVFVEVEVVFNNKQKNSSVNPWVLNDGKWKITIDKKADG
jgi:hypothetical protein